MRIANLGDTEDGAAIFGKELPANILLEMMGDSSTCASGSDLLRLVMFFASRPSRLLAFPPRLPVRLSVTQLK